MKFLYKFYMFGIVLLVHRGFHKASVKTAFCVKRGRLLVYWSVVVGKKGSSVAATGVVSMNNQAGTHMAVNKLMSHRYCMWSKHVKSVEYTNQVYISDCS